MSEIKNCVKYTSVTLTNRNKFTWHLWGEPSGDHPTETRRN